MDEEAKESTKNTDKENNKNVTEPQSYCNKENEQKETNESSESLINNNKPQNDEVIHEIKEQNHNKMVQNNQMTDEAKTEVSNNNTNESINYLPVNSKIKEATLTHSITPSEPPQAPSSKSHTPTMKPSSQPKENIQSVTLDQGSKIQKFPYNGKSKHLIEKIFFIGYEKNNLKKLLEKHKEAEKTKIKEKEKEKKDKEREEKEKEEKKKEDIYQKKINSELEPKEENDESFFFDEKPVVLSEVSSNYDQIYIDNNTVIDLIFPNYPLIYELNTIDEEISNIVFSFNIPLQSTSKTSSNFYTYIYYDAVSLPGLKPYVVPFAICILSEFPYFSNYQAIAESLKKDILIKVPREIILYNIINFIPSPINCSVGVKLNPDGGISNKENYYYFKQLSGYPLFQFDLNELFNILPIDVIIQIFFFTFLENDMIFFSENLEILNIVMYIFANLNYPLNDSTYFFHILSVSLDTFMGGTSPFVTKTFSSLFGINASYSSKINTVSKKQEHFIVDLEKKEFFYKYNEARIEIKEDVQCNQQLHSYIISAMKGVHVEDFLGLAINDLYKELESVAKKVTHRNIGAELVNPEFFKSRKDDEPKIDMNTNLEIMEKMNKQIQEHFYLFTLKILAKFFSYYKIEPPRENQYVFNIDYNEKIGTINNFSTNKNIEEIFIKKFKDCSKFNTYIANFIQNNDSIDLFKIPLLFAEEFINQIICLEQIKEQSKQILLLKSFETIDNFYDQCDLDVGIIFDFDYLYKQIKNSPLILEDYNFLDLVEYYKSYKDLIQSKARVQPYDKMRDINDNVVFKYKAFLKNLNDEKSNEKMNTLFPCLQKRLSHTELLKIPDLSQFNQKEQKDHIKIKGKQVEKKHKRGNYQINECIKESPSSIQDAVERNILQQKQITRNDLIFCSFFYLFIITRKVPINEIKDYLDLTIDLLKLKKKLYSFRKCVTLLVILYYEIIKQKKKEGINAEREMQSLTKMIALIHEENIIPNEELIQYLNESIKQKYVDINEVYKIASQRETSQYLNINKVGEYANPDKTFEKSDVSEINNPTPGLSAFPKTQGVMSKSKNYLQYNLASDGTRKYADFFLKLSENIIFSGDLTLFDKGMDNTSKEEQKNVSKGDLEHKTIYAIPLTQKYCFYTFLFSTLKLYYYSIEMQKAVFKSDLSYKPDYEKLKNITCVLIFYVENISNLLAVGNKENPTAESVAVRENMLEFLYFVLNSIPREQTEVIKYHKAKAKKN